ncbi:MAG: hypothetical protein K8L99_05230, partial [Anaerolineae bacterium]|nr:hypothetical protein [Anaerolineae bacterium]
MVRRFREHDLRSVQGLDGLWDFVFLGDVDPADVRLQGLEYDGRMAVPGCFDATPQYAGKRGLAAYRTSAVLQDATPHRLVFNSVHHWCQVFVDQQLIQEHSGGFTRFTVDIQGHTPGETEIVVLVDNRLDYERSPLHLPYFDWYHFGGISRPVELQRLGALWIDALRVTTTDYAAREVQVQVDWRGVEPPGKTELVITCDEAVIISESVNLSSESGTIEKTVHLPGTKLWSPAAPNLHLLEVRLGEDDMRERIGIRQVRAAQRQILINDEPVRLLGFNRHEAHPQFGHALPETLLVSDVQQLLDMDCNFVRGSHYPQDTRFLDLCDEVGICVWNEATGWQQTAEHLTDRHYLDAAATNISEMIAMSYNHPSVIMWGMLNEGHSQDADCTPAYEHMIGQLREQDESRLITYASNHPMDDLGLDLVDVVSINTYPGWYHGEIDAIPELLQTIVLSLAEKGQGEKPLIISEIGAGAVPGWRDWNATRWS